MDELPVGEAYRRAMEEKQQSALAALKMLLTEQNYVICDVAHFLKKHPDECLAVHMLLPGRLLHIRPQHNGSILVRPFSLGRRRNFRKLLEGLRPQRVFYRNQPFAWSRFRGETWDYYLAEESKEMLQRLYPALLA